MIARKMIISQQQKSDWKKAYVFLKEGNQIDLSIE